MGKLMKALAAVGSLAVMLVAASCCPALAGSYPERPVQIVTPSGAGTGPDAITRIVAERLSREWGRQVVVVNRPGGGGLIAAQSVSTAPRDGYTLYLPLGSTFVVLAQTQVKLPIDFRRDIAPIGLVGEQPMVVSVNSALGVRTLAELFALAKRRPGQILYGAGRGTMPHLTAALLGHRARVDLTFVPYPSVAQALPDTISGTLSMMVEALPTVSGAIQSGKLKPLAVASTRRLPDLPDVPTVAEAVPELAGFEARGWFVLTALTGTPDEVMQRGNQTLQAVLADPEVRQKLAVTGTYARPMSPSDTAQFIRAEQELWRPLVQQLGITSP